jgi:hypothetical protein
MEQHIGRSAAPPLGNLRKLGSGDTIWIRSGANEREDWANYLNAITSAVGRGAEARWEPVR